MKTKPASSLKYPRHLPKCLLFTFIVTLFLPACNILKTIHLLNEGTVSKAHFKNEIPFDFNTGLIIIKVVINGKTYNFIFDSGATNAVSLELAKELNLKPLAHQQALDAENKSESVEFSTLNKISIGGLDYNNIGCAIIDLKKVPEIKCLKVDGLIGANLMKKAVWQIDYKNRHLIVADNIDSFHIPDNTPCVSFTTQLSGTPLFKAQIGCITTGDNEFDLGSNGEIVLSTADLAELRKNDTMHLLKTIRGIGSNAEGLYGGKQDTDYLTKIPSIKLGGAEVKDVVIEFKKGGAAGSGNIGSGFLKNYLVTFDWKNKKAWLIKQSNEMKKRDWLSFGFVPKVENGKMFVRYIYDNSPAQQNGIQLNDQIVSVNSVDFSTITEDAYCDMILNNFPWRNAATLHMVIRSKDGEKNIDLVRKDVFTK